MDELDEEQATTFRQAAGTMMYLAEDVPSIKRATNDTMAGMQTPLKMHWMKLLRIARYLIKHPGEVWSFKYQTLPDQLVEMVDSDWAGDQETRKSVTCVCEIFGLHFPEVIVGKQTVISLSSGEAEFYSVVKGAAMGLQSKQILAGFGAPCELMILSDSSAARGNA